MVQRVAIYARVSTSDQSCGRQVAELEQYAARSGFEIISVITETASGAKNKRPQRQSVMDLARRREIDLVLALLQILPGKIETSYETCFSVRFSDYAASSSSMSDFQNSP